MEFKRGRNGDEKFIFIGYLYFWFVVFSNGFCIIGGIGIYFWIFNEVFKGVYIIIRVMESDILVVISISIGYDGGFVVWFVSVIGG